MTRTAAVSAPQRNAGDGLGTRFHALLARQPRLLQEAGGLVADRTSVGGLREGPEQFAGLLGVPALELELPKGQVETRAPAVPPCDLEGLDRIFRAVALLQRPAEAEMRRR